MRDRIAITYAECVEWILANRGDGDAFKDFDRSQIFNTLKATTQHGGVFCYVLDDRTYEIQGVVLGLEYPEIKQIYITQILCSCNEALRQMLKEFKTRFPGYSLGATRKGVRVNYDTERLVKLLLRRHSYGR